MSDPAFPRHVSRPAARGRHVADMRKVLIGVTLLLATAIGFGGTLAILSLSMSANAPASSNAGKTIYEVALKIDHLGGGNGVKRAVEGDGVALSSSFDRASSANSASGATYHNVDTGALALPPSGRLRIEIGATLAHAEVSQQMEVRFVQNGLRTGDWKPLLLKAGRQFYTIDYDLGADSRPAPRSDTIWIRSDSDGRGRPVTLHSLRLIVLR